MSHGSISTYASGSPYFGSQSQYDGHVGGAVGLGTLVPVLVPVVCVARIEVDVLYVEVCTRVVLAVGSCVTVTVKVDTAVTVITSVIVAVGAGTTAVLVVPSYVSV